MKKHKTRMMMLGFFAVVLAIMGWRMAEAEDDGEAGSQQPLAVSTDTVALTMKPATMPLSGTVEGLTSSIISSRFSGQVTQALVEDGQAVSAGQALFVLDTVELRNALRVAQNSVNQTAAKYANDREEYRRYEVLYDKGAYSRQQLDSARTKMLASQADYDSAQANLDSARKQVDEATVVSPVNGVIANKSLTNGQNVSAGNQLMTVEQLDAVHVVVNVEQRDMAYLKMGDTVNITVDTYPDQTFSGVVDVISPVAGKESRMFRVKIRVENPELLLKPGMFVQVQLNLGNPKQVLTVPQKAVLGQKGLQYIFTVEDGKAKKVRVTAGDIVGDRIEITEGVTEGMVILTDNLDKLKDGNLIQLGATQ
ncbi:RND family efflux transporter, MFP subunit [Selenomonas sp. GACV-9]|uniref:efflux RND transporter periplasmic adaptor subunit n=1 Tax=Selenomonas sp. GACV-9 TaxID=3158782 RepID=UPI0008E6BF40|nr:RND family efflux transporter, MFP subunit [Selenomonas ruminantium]